jgi:hypothetical protein
MGMFVCDALTCLGPYLEAVVSVSYNQSLSSRCPREVPPRIWGSYHMPPVSTLRHIFNVTQRDHELVEELDWAVQSSAD